LETSDGVSARAYTRTSESDPAKLMLAVPVEPMTRGLLAGNAYVRAVVLTSCPSTYDLRADAEPSPCVTATWRHEPSQAGRAQGGETTQMRWLE
jgi:hypothetical protein